MKHLISVLTIGTLLTLAACGPLTTPQPVRGTATLSLSTPTLQVSPLEATLTTETPAAAADNMVRLSIVDLSRQLNVPADQISLVNVTPVTWKDASLGCPKIGVDYIRVETPGYNIILQAGERVYDYHTDQLERVVYCPPLMTPHIYPTP